jgi:hypothetical protein
MFQDKLQNAIVREDVEVQENSKNRIDEKLHIRYGRVRRMEQQSLPRHALEWSPVGASM